MRGLNLMVPICTCRYYEVYETIYPLICPRGAIPYAVLILINKVIKETKSIFPIEMGIAIN